MVCRIRIGMVALGCMLMLNACENTPKCPHGDPTPMFDEEHQMISYHDFGLTGQKSVEEVAFTTGVDLQIFQEGCDDIRQEFQFSVEGNLSEVPDSMWFKQAVRQFYFLSALSEKHKPMAQWGDAIEMVRHQMKLGQKANVAENISITVDKVIGRGESTLLVTLESRSSQ